MPLLFYFEIHVNLNQTKKLRDSKYHACNLSMKFLRYAMTNEYPM